MILIFLNDLQIANKTTSVKFTFEWQSGETTFIYNVIIFFCIVVFALIFHNKFIVSAFILHSWSFVENRYVSYRQYRPFFRNVRNYYASILNTNKNKYKFIDTFGFQIYFFLYLEILFGFGLSMLTILIFSLYYLLLKLYDFDVSFLDFMFGNFDFNKNIEIISFLAFVFMIFILMAFLIAKAEIRNCILTCFGKFKNWETKMGIMASAVYVSKLPSNLTREKFDEQMLSKLELTPKDYFFIHYPDASKLYLRKIKIEKIKNRLDNPDKVYWMFTRNKDKEVENLKASMRKMKEKYKIELFEKTDKTGAGALCIYSPAHLEKLYRFSKKMIKVRHNTFQGAEHSSPLSHFLLFKHDFRLEDCEFAFMFSYDNLNFKNLKSKKSLTVVLKVLFYSMVIFIIVFVSNPLAFVYLLTSLLLGSEATQTMKEKIQFWNSSNIYFILTPTIVSVVNILFLFIIDHLGRQQKFYRFSTYQIFIFKFTFFYLFVNTVLISGFGVSMGESLFEIIKKFDWNFSNFLVRTPIYEHPTVISGIILQSGATAFFLTLNMFADGCMNAFKYWLVFKRLQKVRNYIYLKKEGHLFEFGYYYGYNSVMIFLVIIFGIYRPLVVISGSIYFCLKSYANIVSLTHYFGSQFESPTMLPGLFFNRIKFSVPLMYLLLAMKCLEVKNNSFFYINFYFFICSFLLLIYFQPNLFDFSEVFEIKNFQNFGFIIRISF